MSICPCGSGESYENCCKRFHDGKTPENAELLMRSRYSAYVLNLPDYIVATTHPACPQYSDNFFGWKRSISQFSKNSQFQKLHVRDFKERGTLATVTFTAEILQGEQNATFTERSYFEKKGERWLYLGGQIEEGHAPNMVTTSQFRLLPLAYYGDTILQRKADPIAEITPDINKLVEEMVETMDATDGIGLAAPQVHHSIRLFIMRSVKQLSDDDIEWGNVKVVINPVLLSQSDGTWNAAEGCLSIPALSGEVERAKSIEVEYTNLEGIRVRETLSGWGARVFLHEYDHIEGVLFIERLKEEEKKLLLPELQKMKTRIHDNKAL
ncbi:MAG: peptide deformylase [Parachlamydiaceae bacterium]